MKYLRVFATRREWRGVMNNLIGKRVVFQKPLKDYRDVIYPPVGREGQVVDFTDDLLQVLVVDESTGELFLVPIDAVRVLTVTMVVMESKSGECL